MFRRFLLLVGLALLTCADSPRAFAADPLTGKVLIFGAASTTEAVEAARMEFTRQYPDVAIRTSFAASSTLAQQIIAGAEADLFLSASTQWADAVKEKKLVERQVDLLGNQLVIITPADSKLVIKSPTDLAQAGVLHLALADPKSVPAGIYAKQALERLELWKKLEGKVAGAADVRQALQFVETGAAEAGIVYATDAAASKLVKVVATIDAKLTDPINYPLVLLKHGAENRAAVAFYDFLASDKAAPIFRRYGFIVLAAKEKAKP